MAPASYVVAVRQSSVLFALLFGVARLRERPGRPRILGAVADRGRRGADRTIRLVLLGRGDDGLEPGADVRVLEEPGGPQPRRRWRAPPGGSQLPAGARVASTSPKSSAPRFSFTTGSALRRPESSEMPRPTRSGTASGSPTISPQSETGIPARDAARTLWSMSASTAGCSGS